MKKSTLIALVLVSIASNALASKSLTDWQREQLQIRAGLQYANAEDLKHLSTLVESDKYYDLSVEMCGPHYQLASGYNNTRLLCVNNEDIRILKAKLKPWNQKLGLTQDGAMVTSSAIILLMIKRNIFKLAKLGPVGELAVAANLGVSLGKTVVDLDEDYNHSMFTHTKLTDHVSRYFENNGVFPAIQKFMARQDAREEARKVPELEVLKQQSDRFQEYNSTR